MMGPSPPAGLARLFRIIRSTGFNPCHDPHYFGRDSVISGSGTRKSSDANVLAVKQGFNFAQRSVGCSEVFRLPLRKTLSCLVGVLGRIDALITRAAFSQSLDDQQIFGQPHDSTGVGLILM